MNKDKERALEALKRGVPEQRGSEENQQASKQASLQTNKHPEEELKPFSSYLPSSLIKKVKLVAVQQDRTVREVLQDAVEAYLAKTD